MLNINFKKKNTILIYFSNKNYFKKQLLLQYQINIKKKFKKSRWNQFTCLVQGADYRTIHQG